MISRRLGDLEERQVGAAGDVDENAARALDRGVLEERRGDRGLGRVDRAVLPFRDGRAHQGAAHVRHDLLDVGEVEVDLARAVDQVRDALDRLAQHVVGDLEGLVEAACCARRRRAGAGWGS